MIIQGKNNHRYLHPLQHHRTRLRYHQPSLQYHRHSQQVCHSRQLPTAEAIAHIMVQKFVMSSPLYRQEQEMKRQGIPLSRQTMSSRILRAAADYLMPVYNALHQGLLRCEVLHANETTLQALHYLREQWPYLTNYLKDGRLEISNSSAERSIKPCHRLKILLVCQHAGRRPGQCGHLQPDPKGD